MTKHFLLLVAAVLLAAPAIAADEAQCKLGAIGEDNKVTMPGCPADVKSMIDRAIDCEHWAGEDPYDNARGHEIETAMAELKCDDLSADYDKIQTKYANRDDVIQAMEDADREFSIEF